VVELDQELECVVVGVDKENEKISLGLKQKTPSPWENVEENYQVGARVKGKVVNVMNYGVFVRLEDGIEGLVHISEMSWTRRLNHPGEMLQVGDEIEVVVLNVNRGKQEISLGLKQTEVNPWAVASQKYPQGTIVTAKVRSVTNFGVFVEIEEGIDGMIHISDMSWTRKYGHPSEAVRKDEEIKCVVMEVDEERRRISLGIKQLTEDPWARAIPTKYIAGQIIKGKVTKLTNFGAFVELEPELEGLLHISELADHKIDKPGDIVKLDDEVEVKILKVDTEARKIGLSLRRAQWAAEEQQGEPAAAEDAAAVESTVSESDSAESEQGKDKTGVDKGAEADTTASEEQGQGSAPAETAEPKKDHQLQDTETQQKAQGETPVSEKDSEEKKTETDTDNQ
jgi:small subunit ribosomal protein S1